jgi:hypothetical protein
VPGIKHELETLKSALEHFEKSVISKLRGGDATTDDLHAAEDVAAVDHPWLKADTSMAEVISTKAQQGMTDTTGGTDDSNAGSGSDAGAAGAGSPDAHPGQDG